MSSLRSKSEVTDRLKAILLATVLSIGAVAFSQADELSQADVPGAGLPSLLEWLDQRHPELAAARFEHEAALARVQPAGALPDPMFTVELRDISTSNPRVLPSEVGSTRYQFRQSLPLWGKRDLRSGVAQADADAQLARQTQTRLALRARLKSAYAQWVAALETQASLKQVEHSWVDTERLVRVRYETGLAGQAEVLRAQTELAALTNEQAEAHADEQRAQVRINALLQRPPTAKLTPPAGFAALPGVPTLETLLDRLQQNSPLLVEAGEAVVASGRNAELVRRNRWPDLTIGVAPIQTGSRFDMWELMFEVNLPLQQASRRSQEHEAASLNEAARARRQALEAALIGDLGEAFAAYDMAAHHAHVVRTTLLPQVELNWRSALSAYQAAGRGDLTPVLEAERWVRKIRIDLIKSERDARQQLALMEQLIGGDL